MKYTLMNSVCSGCILLSCIEARVTNSLGQASLLDIFCCSNIKYLYYLFILTLFFNQNFVFWLIPTLVKFEYCECLSFMEVTIFNGLDQCFSTWVPPNYFWVPPKIWTFLFLSINRSLFTGQIFKEKY